MIGWVKRLREILKQRVKTDRAQVEAGLTQDFDWDLEDSTSAFLISSDRNGAIKETAQTSFWGHKEKNSMCSLILAAKCSLNNNCGGNKYAANCSNQTTISYK